MYGGLKWNRRTASLDLFCSITGIPGHTLFMHRCGGYREGKERLPGPSSCLGWDWRFLKTRGGEQSKGEGNGGFSCLNLNVPIKLGFHLA